MLKMESPEKAQKMMMLEPCHFPCLSLDWFHRRLQVMMVKALGAIGKLVSGVCAVEEWLSKVNVLKEQVHKDGFLEQF